MRPPETGRLSYEGDKGVSPTKSSEHTYFLEENTLHMLWFNFALGFNFLSLSFFAKPLSTCILIACVAWRF